MRHASMVVLLWGLPWIAAAESSDPDPMIHLWSWTSEDDIEVSHEDLDGDGIPERIERADSIGSGWRQFHHCIRHGATGHEVCIETRATTYAPMYGYQISEMEPAEANLAVGLLTIPECAEPDPTAPAQGALWQRGRHNPIEGELRIAEPMWLPGAPVAQERVCLTVQQARTLAGGCVWDGGLCPEGDWVVVILPE
jgi:hypothetical protein